MASMLVQIGPRSSASDLVDLLAECHGRIRRFLAMAHALAVTPNITDAEAKNVAGQVRRYFTSAFLHHIADEDELLAPHLTGKGVDDVLAQMHRDHVRHADSVAFLVGLCDAIERDPQQLAASKDELVRGAALVTSFLEPHLELEEKVLFPAIRALPAAIRDRVRDDMRQRRERDFAQ
jgi:hemerythrin-like domain-containing protein